ncbi:MAG: hypothetical protein LIO62_05080 [Clostridiales bacterium]|nr:hypothetical protein [Clostridiales bacterium]
MQKISSKEIVDIIKYSDTSIIMVEKLPIANNPNQYKVQYSVVDFENKSIDVLTKSAYLYKKFGTNYKRIKEIIPNFVQCEAAVLYDRRVLAIYPNGESGIFNRDGELEWTGEFEYHGEVVKCLALEGKYFWSICPKENSVIRYACQNMSVDLRIGSKDAPTFINPSHISFDGNDIYVCCDNNKVRRIDGNNYTVSDYLNFGDTIKKYYKFGKYSVAVLTNDTYVLDENQ